ncbi:hypothetical protein ES319_A03G187100v1 [Gossypium barbadense]|uniref:Uncharacterized protein n=1 Tax=Gossypium barbadense TaxID=3634 RepID=A0A5J5WHH7_GOSBA|nr:hypothetical protein ES319_A03G187100v1 [Gossypium barbadense]
MAFIYFYFALCFDSKVLFSSFQIQTEHKRCLQPSQICKASWSASKPIYHNGVVSLGRAALSIMVVSLLQRQRHTFFFIHLPEVYIY